MKLSLSSFFPPSTEYFYSFPAGEDSSFFNIDPAWKDELFAMRPMVCAGPNVKVITFAATQAHNIKSIIKELGLPEMSSKNIVLLPPKIDSSIQGKKRNNIIKSALKKMVCKNKLIMAQPFLDDKLESTYQFDPKLTVWLNDKKNLQEYIDSSHLPKRFLSYNSGADFASGAEVIGCPCVIKVSSSSSGDGVRICRNASDIKKTKKIFSKIKGSIIVEEYIDFIYNLGIQFGIPYNKKKSIKIIGYNEQLVSSDGEYLGAVVNINKKISVLKDVNNFLLKEILPKVRKIGWYGVGGFDVLIDKNNKFYFIDSNFRMTAVTSYLYLIKNKIINKSIACFTGVFKGGEDKFREVVLPLAAIKSKDRCMQITAVSNAGNCYHFNAAFFFNKPKEIPVISAKLLKKGISSNVLSRFCKQSEFSGIIK